MTRRLVLGIILAFVSLAYIATGWTVVAPGEAAVVLRFGRVLDALWGPGPHLAGPIGVDRVEKVRTDAVRRLTVGLATVPGAADDPGAGEYLTGDLNLVKVEAAVQYRVADPVAFTTRAADVEPLLKRLAESCLARALARQGVDATLREGRALAAVDAARELRQGVERYGLGLAILGVSLTDARPPGEVAADFAAAQSARSDHDRRLTEAKTSAAATITAAKAQATGRLDRARSRGARTLAMASAGVSRFLALDAQAAGSRLLTVRRLYFEALRDLLPRVRRKIVLTPDEPLDLTILGEAR